MEKREVEKLAELARLEFSSSKETKSLAEDIASILRYVSEIQEVSANEPKPEIGERYNIVRDDTNPHAAGAYTEELLAQTPARKDNFVKVKKILSNE